MVHNTYHPSILVFSLAQCHWALNHFLSYQLNRLIRVRRVYLEQAFIDKVYLRDILMGIYYIENNFILN